MVVRLAHGVVTGPDQHAYSLVAGDGAPVAVGPHDADPSAALAALGELVAAGGALAAGAGVELAPGFVSARLDGARGDRRDALLAALPVAEASRLGPREGMLVALFGPTATKPLGAAAEAAIAAGRWGTLQLASAASDLLGPERLEQVLALDAGEPYGMASTLATHLAGALGGYAERRRLDLLIDLCAQVQARSLEEERKRRRLATQGRQSRLPDIRKRWAHHEDDHTLQILHGHLGPEPSLAVTARWVPPPWMAAQARDRLVHDALAATTLLRVAMSVADHGAGEALALHKEELDAAATLVSDHEAALAARRVPGLAGLPARPVCYVRDLARATGSVGGTSKHGLDKLDVYVRQRVARARDYALSVLAAIESAEFLYESWECGGLKRWRAAVGHLRDPGTWVQPPLGGDEPLARRPGGEEAPGDLLWYADLADAVAVLDGHAAAEIAYRPGVPYVDVDPAPEEASPFQPRLDSVVLAAAGAAQLVSLGGRPPARCRTWTELVAGLMASTSLAEAMTGAFELPAALAAWDGKQVPGTRLRVEWAHTPRALAGWSAYMGNCIATPYYVESATKGRSGLAALRDRDGNIAANLEVVPSRGGWRVEELRARFNADPPQDVEERVRAWVRRLVTPAVVLQDPVERPPRGPSGRRPRDRVFAEVGEALIELVAPLSLEVFERVHGGPGAATALRRLGPDRLAAECRRALASAGLVELWRASGTRPLSSALAELDGGAHLDLLTVDAPLLGSLRRLAKHPVIARARSVELVSRRVRAAIGALARSGELDVGRGVSTEALCALVVAVTSWGAPEPLVPISGPGEVTVPGFPRTSLDADPWQSALPTAEELGASVDAFWERVAGGGLAVPSAWLGRGGWNALWRKAADQRR
ncbi:hypothetical protein ACIBG8_43465 [Nonomuraea sp. NPDC050556]|uniref:hypothetical protein n=1 Tax=Nonomuraea sp. NPDC050556 TaxID=3364369 RepID=UPI003793FD5A